MQIPTDCSAGTELGEPGAAPSGDEAPVPEIFEAVQVENRHLGNRFRFEAGRAEDERASGLRSAVSRGKGTR